VLLKEKLPTITENINLNLYKMTKIKQQMGMSVTFQRKDKKRFSKIFRSIKTADKAVNAWRSNGGSIITASKFFYTKKA
jgi:hypothetical protein